MPSFDIVSEVNLHEAANAVDQASREVNTRFDFKGSGAKYELAKQTVTLIQGIDTTLARKVVKLIKDNKMKVQAAINGDKIRVSGKKRDDLQECMSMLRTGEFEQPLQFNNFRD